MSRAPLGSKTAIAVPTTELVDQVAADIVAAGGEVLVFFGVLSKPGVCRYEKQAKALARGGQSIPWELCEGRGKSPCAHQSTCEAYGGRRGPREARIAVGPHAMLAELDAWAGSTGVLAIDEPPSALETVILTLGELQAAFANIRRFEPRYVAAMAPAVAMTIAWVRDGELGYAGTLQAGALGLGGFEELLEAAFVETGAETAYDAARAAFTPEHRGPTNPPLRRLELEMAKFSETIAGSSGETSRVIFALWRCLNIDGALVRLEERGEKDGQPVRALICTFPAAAFRLALKREGSVVVADAAAENHRPVVEKIVGYVPPMFQASPPERVEVARTLVQTGGAVRAAILPKGKIDEERLDKFVEVVVDWALEVPGDALGLITFKAVEELLRREPTSSAEQRIRENLARLPTWIYLGHFGAMRGLNSWTHLDALATIGDPWPNLGDVQHEVDFLSLEGGRDARAEAMARAELEQAHGRLRTYTRTRPARQLHVGRVIPGGWPAWRTRTLDVGRPATKATATASEVKELVVQAGGVGNVLLSLGWVRRTLTRYTSGERAIPPPMLALLRTLAASVVSRQAKE